MLHCRYNIGWDFVSYGGAKKSPRPLGSVPLNERLMTQIQIFAGTFETICDSPAPLHQFTFETGSHQFIIHHR